MANTVSIPPDCSSYTSGYRNASGYWSVHARSYYDWSPTLLGIHHKCGPYGRICDPGIASCIIWIGFIQRLLDFYISHGHLFLDYCFMTFHDPEYLLLTQWTQSSVQIPRS